MNQIYQGDIPLIMNISEEEVKNKVFKPFKEFCVAEGEVSGHRHILVAEREAICEIAQDNTGYYLKINKGSVKLNHPDHETITLNPGLHFIGSQWEYNEVKERRVQD